MLVTCSIGRMSHQSLILYTVARLYTRWRDIEDGNGLPVTTSIPSTYSNDGLSLLPSILSLSSVTMTGSGCPTAYCHYTSISQSRGSRTAGWNMLRGSMDTCPFRHWTSIGRHDGDATRMARGPKTAAGGRWLAWS